MKRVFGGGFGGGGIDGFIGDLDLINVFWCGGLGGIGLFLCRKHFYHNILLFLFWVWIECVFLSY